MQLFGFNMDVGGLALRFSIAFDEASRKDGSSQNRSGLRIEDLPKFELSRE
jgi:hypothetical protein